MWVTYLELQLPGALSKLDERKPSLIIRKIRCQILGNKRNRCIFDKNASYVVF